MKAISTIIVLALASLILAFGPTFKPEKLTVKPDASTIEWYAEKVTGKHNGEVKLKDGQIEVDGNTLIGGSFTVDMSSIIVSDLEGEYKAKLERHLKSEDFFSVDKFPSARLSITEVKPNDDGTFNTQITGDLTIKGITHPITYPAKVEITDGKFAAYGEMIIDRSKYNVKYGSNSFFDNLGDKAIYDEFTLKVSIGAKR